MTSGPIITRFAPSPTGYLHIGGARTALFNWLYAKAKGCKFLLRIEDTDKARSTQAAVDAIMDGMTWLGLGADGDVTSQASRADRHIQVANELLANGKAYKCFLTSDELDALREQAQTSGGVVKSPWRDRTDHPSDQTFVVRFKTPADGTTMIADAVQGDVTFKNDILDDLILLRSDGTPTYNLAVVVDDHDMGVTHIIRGDDHLNNTPRQALIYQAMGWDVPIFAHIPLIHGPDGKKLSKRHGAQAVGDFRDMGYLPEAVRNYLLRLGWSHGDQEFFTDEQAIQAFDLPGINKSPARLDWEKLNTINAHYLAQADDQRLLDLMKRAADVGWTDEHLARITRALPILKTRAKTILELIEQTNFLTAPTPFEFTGKTKKPLKRPDAAEHLSALSAQLADLPNWQTDTLQNTLDTYVTNKGIGFGQIGPALRAALTGGHAAPDLSVVLHALGQNESLIRIQSAVDIAANLAAEA